MANPFTSGSAPISMIAPDLQAQQVQVMRQQQLADMLKQQALQPMGGTEMVSGWAVQKSPWEGLAKMGQAYFGNKMQENADEKSQALAQALQQRKLESFDNMWGVQQPPELQGRDIPTPLNLETGGGNVPEFTPQPQHPLYAKARAAMIGGNEELANKLLSTAMDWTPEQRNMYAMGQDPQLIGRLDVAKRRKEGMMELQPGTTTIDLVTNQERFQPTLAPGIALNNGIASEVPGFAAAQSGIEGAKARATAGAQAENDMIQIDTPNGKVMVTRAQARDMANPSNNPPLPAGTGFSGDLNKVRQEILRLPESADKRAALAQLDAQLNAQKGGGIKLQSAEQGAFQQEAGKKAVELLTASRDKAKAANDDLIAANEIRQSIKGGAYQGTGAELKTDAVKFAQGIGIPLPADFSSKATNSDYLRSTMGSAMLSSIKQLGANPTDADRAELQKIVGTLGKDPQAMSKLLDWREKQSRRVIESHNSDVKGAEKRGLTMPMDYVVNPYSAPNAAPAATPQPKQQQSFDTLPNPAQFSGKRMRAPDGSIIRSNGKQWIKE